MGKQRETFLTRRVLLSLCTAGMLALSLPQAASAADASHSNETITEQVFNDTPGEAAKITVDNCTMNQQLGANEILNANGGIIEVKGNSTINGQIWSGKGGEVKVIGGMINFDLTEPMVRANAATVSLSGVNSTTGDGKDGDHILAENGGKIVIDKGSNFAADISATGNGSVISVKDSTVGDAYAYGGGSITAENGSFDALIAGQNSSKVVGSGSIKLSGGSVNDYIFATDGGTVETLGSTVNISNAVAFNSGSISIAGTAENAKANVTVRGDESDSDDIQPSTIYAYNKGQVALKNVDLTMTDISATPSTEMDKTFIHAEGAGSSIVLDGVQAAFQHNGSGDEPEIMAERGASIEIKDSNLNGGRSADIAAKGSGSTVKLTNSTVEDLDAYEGGAIVAKDSIVGAIHAGQKSGEKGKFSSGTVDIIGGEITDYVTAGGQGVATITDAKLTGGEIIDAHNGGTLILKGKTTMTLVGSGFGAIDNGVVRIEGGTYGAGSSYGSDGTYDDSKNIDMQLITQTNGKIQLQGGKLYAHDFSKLQDKSLVLSGSGELVTTSGQVFEHGIDGANLDDVNEAKKWAANVTDAGAVYNQKIDFQGGKLGLDDAFYTKAYVDSALQALHAVSGNKSQLDLFGKLVDAGGTVVTEIAVDQVPDGAHLRNVTGTTDGKELVIGTDTTGNAMAINGNIGLKNLDLGSAQNVTINNGQSLALYSGNAKGELVASTGGDATITVGDAGTTGILTLGGDGNAAANQGTLSGTVM